MAKVYDALKRVEKEREQHAVAAAAVVAVRRGPVPPPARSVWKRWFGGRPEPPSAPASPPPGVALAEQLEAVISRFDALEERATKTIPSAEHLIQLMQTRLESFETDLARLDATVDALAAQTAGVADRLNERVARLNTRVSVLLAVIAVTLLAVLFRL